MKTTGKEAKGDLQTPITNISEVAGDDEKLAWVCLSFINFAPSLSISFLINFSCPVMNFACLVLLEKT